VIGVGAQTLSSYVPCLTLHANTSVTSAHVRVSVEGTGNESLLDEHDNLYVAPSVRTAQLGKLSLETSNLLTYTFHQPCFC
jgi:hypothetical protein